MKNSLRLLIILAVAVVVLLLVWRLGIYPHSRLAPGNMQGAVQSAVSSTMEYVKSHVTGGVGAMLTMDTVVRAPRIVSILPGSPAESAGLRVGDLLTKVNDSPTAGQPLAQVVEGIRGFTGGNVTVTVQRSGSTNLTFVIQRSSWNAIRGTNSFVTPAKPASTNPLPIYRVAPAGTN